MRFIAVWIAVLVFLAGCGAAERANTTRAIDDVAVSELLAQGFDQRIVLDVRTPEEFAQGHIAGAGL